MEKNKTISTATILLSLFILVALIFPEVAAAIFTLIAIFVSALFGGKPFGR